MKSIKNQYIALKEGKMTEAQFMRNVRMTLPEYISNVTLFKQAEKILMNKGIISEIKVNEASSEYMISKSGSKSNPSYVIEKTDGSKQIDMFFDSEEDAKKYASKKSLKIIKEAKDTSATGYFNQDGKEQYSKFNELDNMNAQEIMAGYVMEKQDNPDKDKMEICKLVIKNLKKDQFYYTNYKLTGVRDQQPTEFTSTKRKPGFDQAEEVSKKADNLKDTKNATTIVKEGLGDAKYFKSISRADSKETPMNTLSAVKKHLKSTFKELTKNEIDYISKEWEKKALKETNTKNATTIVKEGLDNSSLLNEANAEDVKALLDPQTLSKLKIFDRDDETILVYGNYKTIGRDVSDGLQPVYDKYDFYKQNEGDPDGLEYIEYILIPKKSSNEEPKKPSELDDTPIEDIFEGKKDKLKELVRKMMKEMFDGRDNLTDIE